jgi:hypothetical protein
LTGEEENESHDSCDENHELPNSHNEELVMMLDLEESEMDIFEDDVDDNTSLSSPAVYLHLKLQVTKTAQRLQLTVTHTVAMRYHNGCKQKTFKLVGDNIDKK